MQFLPLLLVPALLSLVSADACVAGGPANQVLVAKSCCFSQQGVWYQFYANQAICVVEAGVHASVYQKCVAAVPNSLLDTLCIPGDGGLSGGEGASTTFSTSTATGRITFTAAASSATATVTV